MARLGPLEGFSTDAARLASGRLEERFPVPKRLREELERFGIGCYAVEE